MRRELTPATPAETVNWLKVCAVRARLSIGAANTEATRDRTMVVEKCMMLLFLDEPKVDTKMGI